MNRFAASGRFEVAGASASLDAANDALLRGDVTMVMAIPHDFEASLMRTGAAPIELSLNAEKGSAAGIVQSYAATIVAAYAQELSPAGARPSRIDLRTRSWYNPTLSYPQYMVAGLVVFVVTLVGTLLAAQNIAREKELGTLEQLNVTPITRGEFIVGKLLPFWVLAMIDLTVGLAIGRLVFGVPMRGSLLLLFGVASIYLVAALGIGLWISTLVETQQQAMFVTFFIMVMYLLMSGLFTPIDSMAPWMQVLSLINPVRHFVTISRAVLVKGARLPDIARPFGILVVFAAVALTFAVRQYSKRTA